MSKLQKCYFHVRFQSSTQIPNKNISKSSVDKPVQLAACQPAQTRDGSTSWFSWQWLESRTPAWLECAPLAQCARTWLLANLSLSTAAQTWQFALSQKCRGQSSSVLGGFSSASGYRDGCHTAGPSPVEENLSRDLNVNNLHVIYNLNVKDNRTGLINLE